MCLAPTTISSSPTPRGTRPLVPERAGARRRSARSCPARCPGLAGVAQPLAANAERRVARRRAGQLALPAASGTAGAIRGNRSRVARRGLSRCERHRSPQGDRARDRISSERASARNRRRQHAGVPGRRRHLRREHRRAGADRGASVPAAWTNSPSPRCRWQCPCSRVGAPGGWRGRGVDLESDARAGSHVVRRAGGNAGWRSRARGSAPQLHVRRIERRWGARRFQAAAAPSR